jgi:hypothetical protein
MPRNVNSLVRISDCRSAVPRHAVDFDVGVQQDSSNFYITDPFKGIAFRLDIIPVFFQHINFAAIITDQFFGCPVDETLVRRREYRVGKASSTCKEGFEKSPESFRNGGVGLDGFCPG